MQLIEKTITLKKLHEMKAKTFGTLVKAVVDIEKEVMVVDAALHADEEKHLLDLGSHQDDLWGINLYPESTGDDFIEFDSMINLKPNLNNFSRYIEDEKIRTKIIAIVNKIVQK